ncbi:peptidase, S8/S53 family [Bacteriovorax sp. BSW11_IV]|uniref:S8 family peptidase n=1 Tax=Bacteriovorax sp. BSW11_IV TaxID=1353529 RepID=UPI00038A13B4|nr:S8 family peptidase [Bacteriovorax sp. BSW11_IV]EQC44979.1 peptidase, S8/S53 family [Bacteriovorax sp. BSW11_IV]
MKITSLLMSLCVLSSVSAAEFNGYIVKLKKGSSLLSEKSSLGFEKVQEFSGKTGHFAVIKSDLDLSNKSFGELKNHPDVEYIEPNYIYKISPVSADEVASLATDAKYGDQWALKNTGKNSGGWFSSGKAGEDVNAEKAWEISKGSRDVVVAVIDTGVDHSHNDLKNQMWTNDAELNGQPGVDDDGNGFVDDIYGYDFVNNDGDPMDDHAHGTHCAGVIGASHDGQGIMGVMANVKIMGLKFLSKSGSGETIDAIRSIEYAIQMGADVMSNSWGGGEESQALKEAIEKANEAGIIFVAAAGNSSANNDRTASFPANYDVPNVISVGAMGGNGKKASFSNYGASSVHVFAPGVNILSTVTNNRYQKMSGTSMAAPYVSGLMGLLKTEAPNMSPAEAREVLMRSTVKNGLLDRTSITEGRVDAYELLRSL